MRYLLVAPEISAPWSEGRKQFVRDLCTELAARDDVYLLTTWNEAGDPELPVQVLGVRCRTRACHLGSLVLRLPGAIRRLRPDAVCNFPYGTFRGAYWYANATYMRLVDRIAALGGTPCLSVMYSIDRAVTPARVASVVSRMAVGELARWDGPRVNPGIRFDRTPLQDPTPPGGRRLLFMAGMWQPSTARTDHVLDVRGLGLLLRAGRELAAAGVSLVAAVPLFADAACRHHVLNHPSNTWPEGSLHLESAVEVPGIFQEADLFTFPYQRAIGHFVPTSVLESMHAGTPVAMSNLPMLRPLAGGGSTGYLFPPDDPAALADVVRGALDDATGRQAVRTAARAYVEGNWSIAHSAAQLRALLDPQSPPGDEPGRGGD